MVNELLFFVSILFIALSSVAALRFSAAALTALVCLEVVLMNLFVTKQIVLFGLNATTSDALGIGAVLGINLLREYYGPRVARSTVYLSFAIVIFYTIITWLQLAYIPCPYDLQQPHLVALLGQMPRILAASLCTYLLVESLEYYLYDRLKTMFNNRYFILRNYTIVLFTQLIDTVLFTLLGLYGILNHLTEVIVVSYTIKVITIVCMTPLMLLCKKILDRADHVAF